MSMNLSFKSFRPPSAPTVQGKAIDVRKQTGYQYAGPIPKDPLSPQDPSGLPKDPKVPGYAGLFHNTQKRMGMAHGISHLSPGAQQPVTVHPDVTSKSKSNSKSSATPYPNPAQGSDARRNMEALSYYERNFPGPFHGDVGKVPHLPKGTVDATPADVAALRQFDGLVQAQDPTGSKRLDGEFGASLHRNGNAADNFFTHAPGDGVNIPIRETTGAGYDIHSHPHDTKKPPASADDVYNNAGVSRFPSNGDYLSASRVSVNAEQLGHVPPKYFMTTEGTAIRYSGARPEFDAVRMPPAAIGPKAIDNAGAGGGPQENKSL
jgi:hypothetical protein